MFISRARLENIEDDIKTEGSHRVAETDRIWGNVEELKERIASLEAKLGLKYNPPSTTEASHSTEDAK